ncbi:MAG: cadmium-translocating P-type ATPase [Clostridiales bacterium]|nr:cadmium-translocating P-type ATPase [Candidatus Cacconaster stercorequi]
MSCHCHEHNQHEHGGEAVSRLALFCMAVSAVLLLLSIFLLQGKAQLASCIIAYLLTGWKVLKEAAENMLRGELFDENFLMAVASIGAFCIGEYPEAVAVMLLYSIGELLQDRAVDSSRDAISALINVRPDHANLITENGTVQVEAASVRVGAHILVCPGERIPLDGLICSGSGSVDTSALTGESLPQQWSAGDMALAGCINRDGVLEIEVTKPFEQSSVSRILALVEEAQENKAQPERFITRFAKVYTPFVCAIAAAVAVIPPLMGWGAWTIFIHKALTFLVVSCPCALVISVPLSLFSGIGCASHNGILFKGGNDLELLSKAEIAAFDKTGTLTEGKFRISCLLPAENVSPQQLLEVAAHCESQSGHPLAKAICQAYGGTVDEKRICEIREEAGYGIRALFDGKSALVGKREMLCDLVGDPAADSDTAVYAALDGKYLGRIVLRDEAKKDAAESLSALRKLGFHNLTMLSGDRQSAAQRIGQTLGMDQIFGQLLPEDKVAQLKKLKGQGTLLYVGDGINDAPVLAAADVGIAMGGLGSDAAIESADVVIMSDTLSKIPLAVRIARKTMRIAKENIVFSIAVKVIILALSLVTSVGLWLAVFADVGVCMLAILNSLRALRI